MRVVQIAQHAEDLDRAAAWYQRVLGTPPAARFEPPGLVFFLLDGIRLMLEGGAPSALLYLEVADLHATVDELRADGTAIVTEPHVVFEHPDATLGPAGTAEWMAFVADSEGNQVGLISFCGGELSACRASDTV